MSRDRDDADQRLRLMAELLQLESRCRALQTADEQAFFMVNETYRLTPYRQTLLWERQPGRLRAASGVASLDGHATFCRGMARLCQQWQANYPHAQRIEQAATTAENRDFWQAYLPPYLLWLPLRTAQGAPPLALVLLRDRPWLDAEIVLLEQLGEAYAHAWQALQPRKPGRQRLRKALRSRRSWLGAAIVLGLLMLVPVRQSVLAPAEIVAHRPVMVRAPLAGVIDDILVRPNQPVTQGQPLLRLDARELENQLETARQQFAASDAQYRQAQQQALRDADAKAQLAVLASRREQAYSEVTFLQHQRDRLALAAPRDGVAIFDDASDWIGRSVAVGERIMMIADPLDSELEIQLPAADAIRLEKGAEVRLFLNVAPNAPQSARLEQLGYRAAVTADNVMAYRLRARFADDDPTLRVGLKGTAKVYGQRTVLIAYLLRKPWSSLRVWLGV